MKKIEKVTLIGLGAMGSFFAPRLYDTIGDDFRVIAQGERKIRLQEKGITVNGVNYRFPVVEPSDTSGPSDLIIISVKSYALPQALEDIKNQVGPDTLILPVLNGVESEGQVSEVYGSSHVLYGFMRISIVMENGVASFNPNGGSVHFGEAKNDPEHLSENVQAVKDLFDSCGIPNETDEDMLHGMWFKYACNVGENLTCALFDVPFGAYRENERANYFRRKAMSEVFMVANKLGINLTREDFEAQEHTIRTLPYHNKPSTMQDLEAGKHTEIEMLAGTVVKLGKEVGVDTPLCEFFLNGIHLIEDRNDGAFNEG